MDNMVKFNFKIIQYLRILINLFLKLVKYFSFGFLLLLLLFFYFYFDRILSADFGTINQSYEFVENNELAKAFCDMIKFLQSAIVPIAGITLSIAGIAAFQGKINPVMLVSLALGLAVVKDPGIFINILVPNMNLQFGCKCITQQTIYMRSQAGEVTSAQKWQKVTISTGVDEDCNPINP